MNTTNIPQNIIKAILYLIALDNLQLSPGSGGVGTHKWEDWHWTLAESAYVTSLRLILEPLKELYASKTNITTGQRDIVRKNVKLARDYTGYGLTGHRLLLKIAAFGDDNDWSVANIRFGTPLAKKPAIAKSDSPVAMQPTVIVKNNLLGEMVLRVFWSTTPDTVKLPDGIKFSKVYRFIGTEAPASVAEFQFYGNAKRGKIAVNFVGIDLSGETKKYAWYFARYESNKGELGQAGAWIFAEILS